MVIPHVFLNCFFMNDYFKLWTLVNFLDFVQFKSSSHLYRYLIHKTIVFPWLILLGMSCCGHDHIVVVYNYLFNQKPPALKLWARIAVMARCTRYYIIWYPILDSSLGYDVNACLMYGKYHVPSIKMTTWSSSQCATFDWSMMDGCKARLSDPVHQLPLSLWQFKTSVHRPFPNPSFYW